MTYVILQNVGEHFSREGEAIKLSNIRNLNEMLKMQWELNHIKPYLTAMFYKKEWMVQKERPINSKLQQKKYLLT